jgi:ELWxxDGT repeat protein
MRLMCLLCACAVLAARGALADTDPAFLVKDIDLTPAGFRAMSQIVDVGAEVYLSATTPEAGSKLWKTDGTAAGTAIVNDVMPGAQASGPLVLGKVGGVVFFTAFSPDLGRELWKTDGTAAGTTLVKDIWPGPNSGLSSDVQSAVANNTLFFTARDGHGTELWKSDGTTTGTQLLKDIRPGFDSSFPTDFTVINGTLFFSAYDNPSSSELWKSDGTSAGTVKVKAIAASDLIEFGGTLYFASGSLWKSDGTTAGTVPVQDPVPGPVAQNISKLTNANGTLYFVDYDYDSSSTELWKSDGTSAGTVQVATVPSYWASLFELTAVGTRLFFWTTPDYWYAELWTSDGTSAGTVPLLLLGQLVDAEDPTTTSFSLTSFGGGLFSSTSGDVYSDDTELWKSDGTPSGTVRVKDIQPGPAGSDPQALANVDGELWFSAAGPTGRQLWRSDGSEAGTTPITSFASTKDSDLTSFTDLNGLLMFHPLGAEREPWRSDGTAAGTRMVKDIRPGDSSLGSFFTSSVRFVPMNGSVFFPAWDGVTGTELWKSDGTEAGTVLVKDIRPPTASAPQAGSDPQALTNAGGTLFFHANDGVSGVELWKSDGTAAGTALVKDILPGSGTSLPSQFTSTFAHVNGTVFFSASDGSSGFEPWKSDGTTAGTVRVKDIVAGSGSSSPAGFANVNGTVFFSATTSATGSELWKTDGTDAGTMLVKDIWPGATGSSPIGMTNLNGTLLFLANDGVTGLELWRSDGTNAGTQLVKDIAPGSASTFSSAPVFAVVGGTAFFGVSDASSGYELWKSDGTAAGTVLVKDVFPGPSSGLRGDPVAVGSIVAFMGNDGVSGIALWATDGTTANTHRVSHVAVGTDLLPSGSLLYFEGATDATGTELFAVPIAALMDSDLDGLDYAAEVAHGTNPFDADSDHDGLTDGTEVNASGTNPLVADSDHDGLDDGAEVSVHGTNPLAPDTDCDGYRDGIEVQFGTDPLDPGDVPPVAIPIVGPLALGALAALLLATGARRRRGSV